MLQFMFGMLNNTTLLLFGIFVSAAILNIPFHKKNVTVLLIFSAGVNLLQFIVYKNLGLKGAQWHYPVITHLPSVLLYHLRYKRNLLSSIFVSVK